MLNGKYSQLPIRNIGLCGYKRQKVFIRFAIVNVLQLQIRINLAHANLSPMEIKALTVYIITPLYTVFLFSKYCFLQDIFIKYTKHGVFAVRKKL